MYLNFFQLPIKRTKIFKIMKRTKTFKEKTFKSFVQTSSTPTKKGKILGLDETVIKP